VLVLLATKQLVSLVVPAVQTPVWPSQYAVMQLVQSVADVQVAQGDVHAVQVVEPNVPAGHTKQVLGAVATAVQTTQVEPEVATW